MAHHEPLKALGPINWSDVTGRDLKEFLSTTFSSAHTVVDSIPPHPGNAEPHHHKNNHSDIGRARSHTDSSVLTANNTDHAHPERAGRDHANTTTASSNGHAVPDAAAIANSEKLRKEWKEVKIPPKDNPMDISVFKLAGKDGRGAWFARRSLHEGISYDKFRLGLEREFGETMKNSKGVGTGNVRGIGAEKRAEHIVCDGVGEVEVWLLSAQFPGPTTPRDFLTLLLTGATGEGEEERKKNVPRQFMVVSRPCDHPECQPRSGFIRGNYESVEFIREVPIDKPVRRVQSSMDVKREELRSRHQATKSLDEPHSLNRVSQSFPSLPEFEHAGEHGADAGSETRMAIEWMMVTRSDPGGSVPRFMVEKGTPGGIVNDAGRFIKWLESKRLEDLVEPHGEDKQDSNEDVNKYEGVSATPTARHDPVTLAHAPKTLPNGNTEPPSTQEEVQPGGFYNMIANALEVVHSSVAARLPGFAVSASGADTDSDQTYSSDSDDSDRSFASAQEEDETHTPMANSSATAPPPLPSRPFDARSTAASVEVASTHSGKSDDTSSKASSQHEKALKKLHERQRKLDEKMAKQQERSIAHNGGDKQHQDAAGEDALAKLREKHEKEMARQEEQYRKEVKKIEEKRQKEEKKAEEKRRKAQEKEERENVSIQLERVKVERDVALKQVDILNEQVGALQAQVTKLVAQLGTHEGGQVKADDLVATGLGTIDDGGKVSHGSSSGSK
ncbi:hypothetical protein VPNG_05926 [Cytospora leucostoma]|uniref:DUF3074 domain-containing protein n=1 Tax=Cytospora leucostoma TaxID=1230097 RepID=A0A423XB30_9PEZI|nr:hypothetical protein VPNG_05926 [Cytospora leucostoma]